MMKRLDVMNLVIVLMKIWSRKKREYKKCRSKISKKIGNYKKVIENNIKNKKYKNLKIICDFQLAYFGLTYI